MDFEDIYNIIPISFDICNLIYKYENENILKIEKLLYKALLKYPEVERNILIEFKHNNLFAFINSFMKNNELCDGHIFMYGNKKQILQLIKHPDIINIEFTNSYDRELYLN